MSTLDWRAVWERKGLNGKETASGRSNYGPSQVRVLVDDAVRGLDLKPSDHLLDIGCAAGLMGESMMGMVERYVGVDYSENSIYSFRERCPSADLRVASATDLSQFRDGEFTKTLLSSVILVLSYDEVPVALREMRRVTAAGGRGFASGNLKLKAGTERPSPNDCRTGCTCYAHACWFTLDELAAIAIAAGWESARPVRISDELAQHEYQFDLELYA